MSAFALICDLEATCCNDNSFSHEEMEIIEIGVVAVNNANGEIESEFQSFVRPVRHPTLTEVCRNLTTIRQEEVDQASAFPEVFAAFMSWVETFDDPELGS